LVAVRAVSVLPMTVSAVHSQRRIAHEAGPFRARLLRMAVGARHVAVLAIQWIAGVVVVKHRDRERLIVVTIFAGGIRELRLVWIIALVTRHTVVRVEMPHSDLLITLSNLVTGKARCRDMRSSQRKLGIAIVAFDAVLCGLPLGFIVAALADDAARGAFELPSMGISVAGDAILGDGG